MAGSGLFALWEPGYTVLFRIFWEFKTCPLACFKASISVQNYPGKRLYEDQFKKRLPLKLDTLEDLLNYKYSLRPAVIY